MQYKKGILIKKNKVAIRFILNYNFMNNSFLVEYPIKKFYDKVWIWLYYIDIYFSFYYKEYIKIILMKKNKKIEKYINKKIRKELKILKKLIFLIWDLQSFFKYKGKIIEVKNYSCDGFINVDLYYVFEHENFCYKKIKFTLNEKNKSEERFYLNCKEIIEINYYFNFLKNDLDRILKIIDKNKELFNKKIDTYIIDKKIKEKIDKILKNKIKKWEKEWEKKNNKNLY